METESKPPVKLYAKISMISAEMGRLPKSGYNSFHKYHYVTESDAMDKFRDTCIKHGVIVISSARTPVVMDGITCVDVDYSIIDIEDGGQVTCMVPGQGQDKGDKGIYKALTGSFKYFILKTFLVPTGDDPERDEAPAKTGFKDAKGGVYIESDYPTTPQGQHPVDKLGKLNKEQQEVYHNIADKLVELCGTNGKLMEETLVMATEWRDKETNQVNSPGVKTPLSLMYAKRGKQPKSQAEFALDNLNKLTKETLMNAIAVWKSNG